MDSIRDLLDLMEDLESNPETGDILDFEFGDDVLVETRVVESRDSDLLLEMDMDALEYLGRQFTFEDAEWHGLSEGRNTGGDRFDNEAHLKSKSDEELERLIKKLEKDVEEHPDDDRSKKYLQLAKKVRAGRIGKKTVSEQGVAEGTLAEAEYQGRKVSLGKPFLTPDGPKKRSVYVKNPKGNVVKVNFGQKGVKIKKNNPARRKSFRARHGCDNPGPRHKAKYWSCRFW